MKQCKTCETEKQLTEFFKRVKSKDGLAASCKKCCDVRTTLSRKNKMPQYREAKFRHRRKIKDKFFEWKSNIGCYFCDETFPQCLELHHLDPTKKDITPSQLATGNWDRFMDEAIKCVMVCANCHRKVHYGAIVIDTTKQYIFRDEK